MSRRDYLIAEVSLAGDREQNQDRCLTLARDDTILLALADGLGGHPRGETAAQILVDTVRNQFEATSGPILDPRGFLEDCMQKAHREIVRFGDSQVPPISPRTTVVIALVQEGRAHWGHVGDSRLYLLRNGKTEHVTDDHSKEGESDNDRGALTRCLGGQLLFLRPAWGRPTWLQPGDILLLCSDGLWDQVDDSQLAGEFHDSRHLQQELEHLADRAVHNRPQRSDNVTAVALQWQPARKRLVQSFDDPDRVDAAVAHLQSVINRFTD